MLHHLGGAPLRQQKVLAVSPEGLAILDNLQKVAAERRRRDADPGLEARTRAVKDYQHRRFAASYADLLEQPRYAESSRFFLDELYGPQDFTDRDAQFARVVPGLVRIFPHELVVTVRALSELHALSETMDTSMAARISSPRVDARAYVAAWQAVGQPTVRARQIELMLLVGSALDRYTRNPILRHSLRLMRTPARAAGLSALQSFLESGFDTFRAMKGADAFLATISSRERDLAALLFSVDLTSPRARDELAGLP
ncbi:FFLEELY motif protein [Rubrivivax gelatinosus]|uniref:DUF8198 domain-containing protein n=1 Tax=Rubrivivax gelatinosus TaxID=28068 RepID=A0A4R2MN82_RUBGE|nr:hypothetical protein [Rubrivivax gelatinosus]TCP00753.1 hypothetical protein EV684_112191 [Rubrivivax gelatinosus]